MKILVIVPAYNEEAIIIKTIEDIRSKAPQADILVINDGSGDGTEQALLKNQIRHLTHCVNLGIGGAVQSGYQYAVRNNYDYVVQIDGDGQHDPAYIMPMIEWMQKEELDVGIGSRFIEKEGFQSSSMRRTGIRYLSWLIRIRCGADIRDVTSGYRIVNRKYAALFARHYSDDFPESDSIPFVVYSGGKIGEYPVVMRERSTGKSSISPGKSLYFMVKVSISILLSKFLYPVTRTDA